MQKCLVTSLAVLIALCVPAQVWAQCQVTSGARGTAAGIATPLNSPSITVSDSASPLIACVSWQTHTTPALDSVVWDPTGANQAMTLIDSTNDNATHRGACYGLLTPTAATAAVRATFSAAPTNTASVHVIATEGCDSTTGWRTSQTRTNAGGNGDATGTGPGMTLSNFQSGDLVFHFVTVFASTITIDADEDDTNTEDDNVSGNGHSASLATDDDATLDATDAANYTEIAFAVIPDSGGGGGGSAKPNTSMLGILE